MIKTEIALARDEVRREVKGLVRGAVAFAVAAVLAVLALANMLIGWALAIEPHSAPAWIAAVVLLTAAGVAAFVGVRSLPKKPLDHTRERVQTDVQVLKETMA